MKKTTYQIPELRDENNNIIQNGAFGRKTAFVTADNQGVLDYIMNDLEALKDMQAGAYTFVDSLPSTGDLTKVYVVKSTGKLYRWDAEGTSWVPFDTAVNGVGIVSADMDVDGTLTLNLTNGKKASTTFKPLQEAAKIVNTAASSASSASESATNARAAMNTANTAASSASTSAANASTSASNASKSEIAAKTAQAAAEKARDDANSVVTKLTGVMKYAGQVNNYSDLSDVTKNTGDVWNIVNADTANGIKAGDNVAWNGSNWDNLSGTVDLSIYAEKADYQKTITSATANGATITFSHKDGTTSTVTVNNVASATAATNDAKGQKIDTTYEKIADASNVHTSLQNSINGLSTGKQDKLTFDNVPTANSSNPVTSGGIKTVLDTKLDKTGTAVSASKLKTARTISLTGNVSGSATFDGSTNINISTTVNESKHAAAADTATKATQDASGNVISDTYATKSSLSSYQTKLTFDSTPTANSSNPVTSAGIKAAIDAKTVDLSNYYTKTQVDSAISTAISAITDGDNNSY